MSDNWQKIDSKESVLILDEINKHLSPVTFSTENTIIRTQELLFYKDHSLVEMTDLSVVPAAKKYAIYKKGDVNIIDWTNDVIYKINEKAPLILNEETIASYIKFFFSYVRGRHGRFLVIETIDDVRWQIEPPMQGRRVMQDMLEPITLISNEADSTFNLEAFMVFKDSLFKTQVHVKSDGLVSMSSEELKIEGMPVLQDISA